LEILSHVSLEKNKVNHEKGLKIDSTGKEGKEERENISDQKPLNLFSEAGRAWGKQTLGPSHKTEKEKYTPDGGAMTRRGVGQDAETQEETEKKGLKVGPADYSRYRRSR